MFAKSKSSEQQTLRNREIAQLEALVYKYSELLGVSVCVFVCECYLCVCVFVLFVCLCYLCVCVICVFVLFVCLCVCV